MNEETQLDMLPDEGPLPDDASIAITQPKWSKTVARWFDSLTDLFRRRGRTPDAAMQEAYAVVAELSRLEGGREFYLATGDRLHAAMQARQIYHQWRGNNEEALASQYRLTPRRIRQIVAEQRSIDIGRRQGKLFPS